MTCSPFMVKCNGCQEPGQESQFILKLSSMVTKPLWSIYLGSRQVVCKLPYRPHTLCLSSQFPDAAREQGNDKHIPQVRDQLYVIDSGISMETVNT